MGLLPEDQRWEFTGREELEALLEEAGVERDHVCLVGSLPLSVRGLRDHDTVGVCVLPDRRSDVPDIDEGSPVTLVTDPFEVIGLSDEELISDETYHDVVDGFKIVRPELTFSYKRLRESPQDEKDIDLLEEYLLTTDDWDWDLYRTDYGERPTSLLSRGIHSLRSDGFYITFDKVVGLVFRKFPFLRRVSKAIPVHDAKTPLQTVTNATLTVNVAELLNRQYGGERFESMDTVGYWAAMEGNVSFEPESLTIAIEEVQADRVDDLEPIRVSQRHRILDPAAAARLIQEGREEVEIKFSFERRTPRDEQWVRSQFDEATAALLDDQRVEMLESVGGLFYAIFWPPTIDHFDEMEALLGKKVRVHDSTDIVVDDVEDFVKDIYKAQTHPAPEWSIDWKAKMMLDFPSTVRVVRMELPEPRMRYGISREIEMVKNDVRHAFMDEFPDEFYVCLLHATDCFEDNLATKAVVDDHTEAIGSSNDSGAVSAPDASARTDERTKEDGQSLDGEPSEPST